MPLPPDPDRGPRLFSEHKAAEYLGISYWTVRDLRFRREFPTVKIKRRILIDKQDLDSYITRTKKEEGG